MRNVNMIWKRQNYIGSTNKTKNNKMLGINQLKKSLGHSLRIDKKHDLEFNTELSGNNLIFHNGKIIKLDDINIENRKILLNDIIDPIVNLKNSKTTKTEINKDLSKYKYKLNQMLISNPDDPSFKKFINKIIDTKVSINKEKALSILSGFDLKRKNEKLKCLETFIDLKNNSLESSIDIPESFNRKRTVIQEAFWKFPFNQDINDIKPNDYIEIINKFYKENFPDYKIELIVFHGDEIVDEEDNNKGVHPHIFINGKNSKTNKYDLIDAEFDLINKFRAENNNEPLDRNDGFYNTTVALGMDYQQIIYNYVNKELKERNYKYNVVIQEDTPERALKRKLIKKDANLPKVFRLFNLLNYSKEKLKNIEDTIEIKQSIKDKFLNEIQKLKNKFENAKEEYDLKFENAKKEYDFNFKNHKENRKTEIKKDLEKYKKEIKEPIEKEITALKGNLEKELTKYSEELIRGKEYLIEKSESLVFTINQKNMNIKYEYERIKDLKDLLIFNAQQEKETDKTSLKDLNKSVDHLLNTLGGDAYMFKDEIMPQINAELKANKSEYRLEEVKNIFTKKSIKIKKIKQ